MNLSISHVIYVMGCKLLTYNRNFVMSMRSEMVEGICFKSISLYGKTFS